MAEAGRRDYEPEAALMAVLECLIVTPIRIGLPAHVLPRSAVLVLNGNEIKGRRPNRDEEKLRNPPRPSRLCALAALRNILSLF